MRRTRSSILEPMGSERDQTTNALAPHWFQNSQRFKIDQRDLSCVIFQSKGGGGERERERQHDAAVDFRTKGFRTKGFRTRQQKQKVRERPSFVFRKSGNVISSGPQPTCREVSLLYGLLCCVCVVCLVLCCVVVLVMLYFFSVFLLF
jgi:hypothetical protein